MMLLKAHFVNDYTSKAELIIFVSKNRKSKKMSSLKKISEHRKKSQNIRENNPEIKTKIPKNPSKNY